jgi:hypothetical protein
VKRFWQHILHHCDRDLLEQLPTGDVQGYLNNYLRYVRWPVRISSEVVVGTVTCSIIVSKSTLERVSACKYRSLQEGRIPRTRSSAKK